MFQNFEFPKIKIHFGVSGASFLHSHTVLFMQKRAKNAQNALGFEHSHTPSNKVFASCFTMNKIHSWGTPLS
jgi:hypothetical protein